VTQDSVAYVGPFTISLDVALLVESLHHKTGSSGSIPSGVLENFQVTQFFCLQ
jgi:hypothetical protein